MQLRNYTYISPEFTFRPALNQANRDFMFGMPESTFRSDNEIRTRLRYALLSDGNIIYVDPLTMKGYTSGANGFRNGVVFPLRELEYNGFVWICKVG